MATYTSYLNLEKPTTSETFNLLKMNQNWDKIDAGVSALSSKMAYSRANATPNGTYIESGAVYIYSIGNIKIIKFSDIKFKESLPSSSASNQTTLFTLPFTIASGKSEIFILTKQEDAPTTIRLMAKENVITPWWSSIGVTSGEGFFGIVVCMVQ